MPGDLLVVTEGAPGTRVLLRLYPAQGSPHPKHPAPSPDTRSERALSPVPIYGGSESQTCVGTRAPRPCCAQNMRSLSSVGGTG